MKEAPRRLPYALRQQLELELDKLLKIRYIEPTNSPYASPLVLVRKPDGSLTLCNCLDYHTINKDTNPDIESGTISLQQVLKCRGSFPTNQSWLGHNITKPRRRRTVRKRISKYLTSNVNPDKEQTNEPGYIGHGMEEK